MTVALAGVHPHVVPVYLNAVLRLHWKQQTPQTRVILIGIGVGITKVEHFGSLSNPQKQIWNVCRDSNSVLVILSGGMVLETRLHVSCTT